MSNIKLYDTVKDNQTGKRFRVTEVIGEGGSLVATLKMLDENGKAKKGRGRKMGVEALENGYTRIDLPEVTLVAILDADKEGFLRSDTALIQTIGRAARNSEGRVIMYADVMTDSMKRAIGETERRRKVQAAYNAKHGIIPKTIIKEVKSTLNITKKKTADDIKMQEIPDEIEKLKALMKVASGQLDFERAIEIREKIAELKMRLRKAGK